MIRIVAYFSVVQAALVGTVASWSGRCSADSTAAAAAGSALEAALSSPLDRRTLLRAVVARSPAVRASEQRAQAIRTDARAEGSFPSPEAMTQVWQVPLSKPYALDTQMIMIGVSQQFPSPGSRGAREQAMLAQAKGEEAMARERGRQVAREAGHAFADYSESSARHRLHRSQALVARHLVDVAEARHAAGGPLADAMRAEVELSRIEVDVLTDATRVESAKAHINALLARDPRAALGEAIETEPQVPSWDLTTLLAKARSTRPEGAAAQAEQEARTFLARAAEREATLPAFSLGAIYFPPTQANAYHGYGATASLSLPWLWGGAGDRRAAAQQYLEAANSGVAASRISIDSEVLSSATLAESAAHRLQMLRDRTLPAGRRAFDVTQAGYESGRTDLMTVLDAGRSVLEIEHDVLAARSSLDHALTDLDAAVGIDVPTRAIGPEERGNDARGDSHAP